MTGVRLPDRTLLPPPGSRVFFLGVAGAGMSGLAALFAAEGFAVWGTDADLAPEAERLARAGIRLAGLEDLGPAVEAALVVHTSAAPPDHPALVAARRAGVPIVKRSRAMGALLNGRPLVGVSGTHGKTTITAMTARVAETGGLDPRVLVGGRVAEWDGNARVGTGPAIAEADEFDRSFLDLSPTLAVVTSVEPEHLECYDGPEHLAAAFREFAGRAADRGGVLACAEGAGALAAVEGLPGVATYGLDAAADHRVTILERSGMSQRCRYESNGDRFEFDLGVPGNHNAQNAAAALAVGLRLGVETDRITGALASFHGVDRRLQVLGQVDGRVIVDDYAHHPTEVAVSLAAAREAWPDRRLAVAFQPHLYSRTRGMATAFARALAAADDARVLPIYPAREAPIPGVTSALVVEASGERVTPLDPETVGEWVDGLPPDAVVVFMGAGDVTRIARAVAAGKEVNGVGA